MLSLRRSRPEQNQEEALSVTRLTPKEAGSREERGAMHVQEQLGR